MQDEVERKVIRRIKLLLEKSDGCKKINSEHEAEAALNMAYSLMRKHHLDMSTVMSSGEDSDIEIQDSEAEAYIANKIPLYLSTLIQIINIICNTYCLIRRTESGKSAKRLSTSFIGEKRDVENAIKMYMFFKKVTHRLANKHQKDVNGNFTNWRSFAEGFTSRLLEKAIDRKNRNQERIKRFKDESDGLTDISGEDSDSGEEVSDEEIFETSLTINQELQIFEFQERVRKKIKEYIDSKSDTYEKIKIKSKVNMNSYYSGRVEADNYSLDIKPESKQLTVN